MILGCKDLEKSGPGPDTKSKHDHGRGQYLTDFDDFGVNRKPGLSAVQRGQNHQNSLRINPVRGHVLIQPGPGPDFSRSLQLSEFVTLFSGFKFLSMILIFPKKKILIWSQI